jgi:hypothetical protein
LIGSLMILSQCLTVSDDLSCMRDLIKLTK